MTVDTARERTRLAWRRTVLTATVVALLFVRLAGPAGALVALPWLVVLAVAQRRIGAMGHAGTIASGGELRLLAAVIVTLAVSGAALAVLP